MSFVQHRFLFRVAHPCRYVKSDADPRGRAAARIVRWTIASKNFAAMDEQKNCAEVCLAWNEFGIGLQVEVRQAAAAGRQCGAARAAPTASRSGSTRATPGPAIAPRAIAISSTSSHPAPARSTTSPRSSRPRSIALWKTLHSARPIERALQGAFRAKAAICWKRLCRRRRLNGYDPEEHRRLGFFYAVRDDELGEQRNVTPEFPIPTGRPELVECAAGTESACDVCADDSLTAAARLLRPPVP